MRNDSLVKPRATGIRRVRHRGTGIRVERLRGHGRQEQDRGRAGERPRSAGLDHLSRAILTYYGRWTYKIEEARRQGAAGILMIHTTESATYPWTTVSRAGPDPRCGSMSRPPSLLVAGWLSQDAAAKLFRQVARTSPASWTQAARRGSRRCLLGVQLDATVRSGIRRSETSNVLGRWPGRGPWRGGGADRRTLRSLRHRRPGGRRLDLQRRRGQCVGHCRGADRGRGLRQERGADRAGRSSSSGSPRKSRGCSDPRPWSAKPTIPLTASPPS